MASTTTAGTIASSVLTDLQEDPDDPVFWSREEILELIWEGLVELNLMTGLIQETTTITLTGDSIQASPSGIAILHMRNGNKALLKYSMDDMDSQFPKWESERAAAPTRWTSIGTNLVMTHPRTTQSTVSISVDMLSLPASLDEASVVPLEDEYCQLLQQYAFHVARLKEGGREFIQAMSSYENFNAGTADIATRAAWINAPQWDQSPKTLLAAAVPRQR